MKYLKAIAMFNLNVTVFLIYVFVMSSCGGNNSKTASESAPPQAPSTPIHEAVFLGNLKAIEMHVKAGTDLNAKDEYGSSPLAIAATFGKTEAALALIEGGADINLKSGDGSTPLHVAAFFCRTKIVDALLAARVDTKLRDNYGSTALQTVSGPFEEVQPIYDQISKELGPLGLKLDYGHLSDTRPVIAQKLSEAQL